MKVEHLRNYKSALYSASAKELSEFERNFLFVSSGTLAFTMTFIQNTTPLDKANFIWMLLVSWLLIVLSIGLIFWTYWKSAKLSQKLFEEVDRYLELNELFRDDIELRNEQAIQVRGIVKRVLEPGKVALWRLRLWCIIFFLSGLLFISTFVVINIYHIY